MLTFLLLIILVLNVITCVFLINTKRINDSNIEDIVEKYNNILFKDKPTIKRIKPGMYRDDEYVYFKNCKISLKDVRESFHEACDRVFNKKEEE